MSVHPHAHDDTPRYLQRTSVCTAGADDRAQIARAAHQPARDIRKAAAKLIMWRAETLLL